MEAGSNGNLSLAENSHEDQNLKYLEPACNKNNFGPLLYCCIHISLHFYVLYFVSMEKIMPKGYH